MLYPQMNSKRLVVSLNGLWQFSFVTDDYVPLSPLKNSRLMGVPGSYNEVVTDIKEREYVGKICYERNLYIQEFSNDTFWTIRFGAATHHAWIYLDGILVYEHEGGFLPFDVVIQNPKPQMRLSVILDTRLGFQSLPMGELKGDKQLIYFDFFNFIGLHRDVLLYKRPIKYIKGIRIQTKHNHQEAIIHYGIETDDTIEVVEVINPSGEVVVKSNQKKDTVMIQNPDIWDIYQGNLYRLRVTTTHDLYEQTFGIREVEIKDQQLYLNHKPIFLKGFGMHEDHETLGKGNHPILNLRDFELLKWIGANSLRTSHYPYDEQIYDLADRYGILIIDEIPAVGMNFWDPRPIFIQERVNEESLSNYKNQFKALVERDQNHPSVIMYSLANEANTHEIGSVKFFKEAFDFVRTLTALPLMIVENVTAEVNLVAQFADIIGINRYHGWYTDFSDLSVIDSQIKHSIHSYLDKFHKPVMLTEFGADTISGMHTLPALAFSEEFQNEFIETYLNSIESIPGLVGTHIWNFADFQTKQGLTRMLGNKKGVFTRNRQPKLVAHTLRRRWTQKY